MASVLARPRSRLWLSATPQLQVLCSHVPQLPAATLQLIAVDSSTSEKVEATASGVGVAESDDVVEPVPQPRTRQVPNYPYQQLKQMLMTFRFDQKKGVRVSENGVLSGQCPPYFSLKLTKATLEALLKSS